METPTTPSQAEGQPQTDKPIDLDTLSQTEATEHLMNILRNPQAQQDPVQEQTQEAPAETPEEPAEEPETDEEPTEPAKSGYEVSKRFRFRDANDIKFAELRKLGVDPAEATKIAYGLKPVDHGSVEPGTQSEPEKESDPLADLDAEIDALAELKSTAQTDYEREEEARLDKEITKLLRKRQDVVAKQVVMEREIAKEAQTKEETAYNESVAKAVQNFPDLQDPKSVFSQRAQEIRDYLITNNDSRVSSLEFPTLLAQLTAADLNVIPAIPSKIKGLVPPTQNRATPTPSGMPRNPTPQTLSSQAAPPVAPITADDLDNMSLAERNLLIRQVMKRT